MFKFEKLGPYYIGINNDDEVVASIQGTEYKSTSSINGHTLFITNKRFKVTIDWEFDR
jgi:hypothetical protein